MKSWIYMLVLMLFFTSGCKVTEGTENPIVNEGIKQHKYVLADEMFSEILKELDSEGSIDWTGRLENVKDEVAKYDSRIEWLLAKYRVDGVFKSTEIGLWRKWNPFSSTTAVTDFCGTATKLNKWKIADDKYSIVNTLIHERTHSFCLIHPEDQTRGTNMCDAAYIAGDLAEILMLRKDGIKERKMDKPICPALLEKIKKYNLIIVK